MRRHTGRNSKTLMYGLLPVLTLVLISTVTYYATTYEPSWDFDWEGIRPEIVDTVKKMDAIGYISSGTEGAAGITPKHYLTRFRLMRNATDEELYRLLDYPQGAVKASAYEALLHRKKYDHYELLRKALDDTTTFVSYRSGCLGDLMLLSEYLTWHSYYCLREEYCPTMPIEMQKKMPITANQLQELREIYAERIVKKEEYYEKYDDQRQ